MSRWTTLGQSLALALGLVMAGCTAGVADPASTLDEYVDAVRGKDGDTVYELLDESTRRGMSREEFNVYLEEHYDSVLDEAETMNTALTAGPVKVVAELPVGAARTATLTYADGRWAMADDQLVTASQKTPYQAVAAFIAALDESNFEVILGVLGTDRRAEVVGEIVALRQAVAQGLRDGIVIRGDRAILSLDGGSRLILGREAGAWKVTELRQSK